MFLYFMYRYIVYNYYYIITIWYVYAVKWLIAINRIQNKSFCLHNAYLFLCTVYIYNVYI